MEMSSKAVLLLALFLSLVAFPRLYSAWKKRKLTKAGFTDLKLVLDANNMTEQAFWSFSKTASLQVRTRVSRGRLYVNAADAVEVLRYRRSLDHSGQAAVKSDALYTAAAAVTAFAPILFPSAEADNGRASDVVDIDMRGVSVHRLRATLNDLVEDGGDEYVILRHAIEWMKEKGNLTKRGSKAVFYIMQFYKLEELPQDNEGMVKEEIYTKMAEILEQYPAQEGDEDYIDDEASYWTEQSVAIYTHVLFNVLKYKPQAAYRVMSLINQLTR